MSLIIGIFKMTTNKTPAPNWLKSLVNSLFRLFLKL